MKNTALLILFGLIIVTSCYYDSEEALFPVVDSLGAKCDTSNVTYSGNVTTMLNSSCLSCHQIQVPIFNSYNVVVAYSDRIYGDIQHKSGYDPMPKAPSPMLDSCTIKQFGRWINEGKPSI